MNQTYIRPFAPAEPALAPEDAAAITFQQEEVRRFKRQDATAREARRQSWLRSARSVGTLFPFSQPAS